MFKGSKPSEREGRQNPKVHGEIPGYPVGSKFKNRGELSAAGVHGPLRAGIHGNRTDGAYSVVLSYGYEDDNDSGETFIYTGHGGRGSVSSEASKLMGKESWDSQQTSDQEWKLGNKALKISSETGNPVRVIRGAPGDPKKQHLFPYAPGKGLRYDGLYYVTDAWRDVGKTGFKTCKFIFQRIPGQLPLPSSNRLLGVFRSPKKAPIETPPVDRRPRTSPYSGSRPDTTTTQVSRSGRQNISIGNSEPGPSKPTLRKPHVPRPPYRPSAEDLAKLKSNEVRSRSSVYSLPSSAHVPLSLRHPLPPTPESMPSKNLQLQRRRTRDGMLEPSGKIEME